MIAHHYKRIQSGMRCHCFSEEPEDVGICRTCYGVGIRGGYEYAQLPRINPYHLKEVDHNIVQFGVDFAHFVIPGDVVVLQKEGEGVPYYVTQVTGSAASIPANVSVQDTGTSRFVPTVGALGWSVTIREVENTDPVYVFCLDWAAM